jgi:hypothetical protein
MMDVSEIIGRRLANQGISCPGKPRPEEIVSSLGALQAQDYQAALWAVGLRGDGIKREDVQVAIEKRKIIRTWTMRGTWHLVMPENVRWMLSLYPDDKPIPSYQARNGMTDMVLKKGLSIIPKAFIHEPRLTYDELGRALEDSGIKALGKAEVQRHIIRRAGREGIICFDGHKGRQPAFALMEKVVPEAKQLSRKDAISKFALMYFNSHGPATIKDFAWWSGLNLSDAKSGIGSAAQHLKMEECNSIAYWMPRRQKQYGSDGTYLLPAFDEYLISYKDRSAILDQQHAKKVINGTTLTFLPMVLSEGRIVGTWKKIESKGKTEISIAPFDKLDGSQRNGIREEVKRYGDFLGTAISIRPF